MKISFSPKNVAFYTGSVFNKRRELIGEFQFEAFDPKLVRVTLPNSARAFEPVTFEINSSEAGSGTVDVQVKDPAGEIVTCEKNLDQTCLQEVTFLPFFAGKYRIEIKFNSIRLSAREIDVGELAPVVVQPLDESVRNLTATFEVSVPRHLINKLSFSVRSSSGERSLLWLCKF